MWYRWEYKDHELTPTHLVLTHAHIYTNNYVHVYTRLHAHTHARAHTNTSTHTQLTKGPAFRRVHFQYIVPLQHKRTTEQLCKSTSAYNT